MLRYINSSLLNSNAQTVVNTVNTVGVMGKGLAKSFRDKHPDMFEHYKLLCDKNLLKVGTLWLWKGSPQWVLNFPTKTHWRYPSKLEYIEDGLKKFVQNYEDKGITEIAFPKLGCGNGGLDWGDVRPLMELYLAKLPITVYVHDFDEKFGLPEHVEVNESFRFQRSFDSFWKDLEKFIGTTPRGFRATTQSGSQFFAWVNLPDRVVIEQPNGKKNNLHKEDFYGAWSMLIRGPLTVDKLVGPIRNSASYVMPLIMSLPYVRKVAVKNYDSSVHSIGAELVTGLQDTKTIEIQAA